MLKIYYNIRGLVILIYSTTLNYETKGYSDILNITNDVQDAINKSGFTNGIVNIFVIGSTASYQLLNLNLH
jgi:thiamine phosphate synthase YjbQ (UPF0047 family)